MSTEQIQLVTEEQMDEASAYIASCPQVFRTPLLKHAQYFLKGSSNLLDTVKVALKLENLQNTGSFKIRGLVNQKRFLPEDVLSGKRRLITMSAGNYGKAYGFLLHEMGLSGVCIIPQSAPLNRAQTVQSYGIDVKLVPTSELISAMEEYINQHGCHLLHSYNDINLITAYTSIADEILDDEPDVDVVIVGCGGGALLAGIAARIKGRRPRCRVYGVEPEGACTMYESFKQNRPVTIKESSSVASGLSPPSAGAIPYAHCAEHVDEIILVSENEIVDCVRILYNTKLIVEPAGCASLAALLTGKIPDVTQKSVVVLISGGNITLDELVPLLS